MSREAIEQFDRAMDEAQDVIDRITHPLARFCRVCRRLLEPGDRKVHRGACARKRKTELQKLRRSRRRV